MAKRKHDYQLSEEQVSREYWPTPQPAIRPLASYVKGLTYVEPCAGAAHLVRGLFRTAKCVAAYDIEPQDAYVKQRDARTLTIEDMKGADIIITNPPFSDERMHVLLNHLMGLLPTWFLLPSDKAQNEGFQPLMRHCSDMVPIGRVSWLENGQGGYENYSWYRFSKKWDQGFTRLRRREVFR